MSSTGDLFAFYFLHTSLASTCLILGVGTGGELKEQSPRAWDRQAGGKADHNVESLLFQPRPLCGHV